MLISVVKHCNSFCILWDIAHDWQTNESVEGDWSIIPFVFISLWRTNRYTVDKHLWQRWEILHQYLAPHVNLLTYVAVAPEQPHFHVNDPLFPCRFLSCLQVSFSKPYKTWDVKFKHDGEGHDKLLFASTGEASFIAIHQRALLFLCYFSWVNWAVHLCL